MIRKLAKRGIIYLVIGMVFICSVEVRASECEYEVGNENVNTKEDIIDGSNDIIVDDVDEFKIGDKKVTI